MVQNKKNIKITDTSKINIYNPTMERLRKSNQRREKMQQKFTMKKQTKRKIRALLAATGIALGSFGTASSVFAEFTGPQDTCTIAVANDDAKITVDGEDYQVDKNSFVLVSENQAMAYDTNGNIQKGYMDDEDFQEIMQIAESEMLNYTVIYQVTSTGNVNVRSSGAIEDDNIISTVSSNDYVLGYSTNTSEYDGEWIPTLSTNGDTIYQGYIREDLLQEVGRINTEADKVEDNREGKMIVDTSKDGGCDLNLRTQPDVSNKSNIITQIPNGSTVYIISEPITSGNRNWCLIEYITKHGETVQGWVAADYLTTYVTQEQKNITKGTVETNATGNVTGIDVSWITPDDLREVLQNGIPEKVKTTYGTVNTSKLASSINFVYMKLGASPYGKKANFEPVDYNKYVEQVKVCEELGVPYGFYYYSTATTVEEAKIELEHIQQKIEDLRQTCDMENNKLEIVIDIELVGTNDRQYKGNIKEQTRAKAALINGIQEAGLSDNVLIYGPSRVLKPDSDRIIDLEYLRTLLSNPDDVSLWLCSPTTTGGSLKKSLESDIEYFEELGFSVVANQMVLDGDLSGIIDINNMSLEHFEQMIERSILDEKDLDEER